MKKVTLNNYMTEKYYPRIVAAVDRTLKSQNFVTPIAVFIAIGLLDQWETDQWRKGQISYLELVLKCNLAKANRILRILRFHADDLNLKPSITVYCRRTACGNIPLQFSKSGDRNLEEAYSRHFVRPDKSSRVNPSDWQEAPLF